MRFALYVACLVTFGLSYGSIAHTAHPTAMPLEDCIGCQIRDAEDSDNATCLGCKVVMWATTSAFWEECDEPNVDCEDAECQYRFKVKYKTVPTSSGDCNGKTWGFGTGTPSDRILGEQSTAKTIITKLITGLCGVNEGFTYTMTSLDCASTVATISGSNGCFLCSGEIDE